MTVYSVYCHIFVNMYCGRATSACMYTAIETKAGEKEYWRTLNQFQAGIAMRKLEKATGVHPEIRYNTLDDCLTSKEIVYYREG